jgi:hypothetical protein
MGALTAVKQFIRFIRVLFSICTLSYLVNQRTCNLLGRKFGGRVRGPDREPVALTCGYATWTQCHPNGKGNQGHRDANRTVYGYGRTFDCEHTASGRTVTYPYLHVKNHLTVRYGDYYGRHTGQDGVW